MRPGRLRTALAVAAVLALSACVARTVPSADPPGPSARSAARSSAEAETDATAAPSSVDESAVAGATETTARDSQPSPAALAPARGSPSATASPGVTGLAGTTGVSGVTGPAGAPIIAIDPGHAPTIDSTDPATGLNDSDYENEPEMQDVFAVALLVRAKLLADGYRVIMTKNNVTDRVSLGQRAAIANNAHAALALSIHDQAGSNGGIGFTAGNNIVYYQAVGDYRATASGTRITFTDATLAASSQKCGAAVPDRTGRGPRRSRKAAGQCGL